MWEVFTLNSTPMKWRGNHNVCFHSHDGVDSRNLLEHVQTATHQEGSSGRRVRQHAPDHRTVWKRHQGTAKQKNKFILVTVWVCCGKNKTKKTTLKKSVMCNIKCCDPCRFGSKGSISAAWVPLVHFQVNVHLCSETFLTPWFCPLWIPD